jgi:uroporphyrinogen decarboxylase
MMNRRQFLFAAAAVGANAQMTPKERVRRALKGEDVDRPPFSVWHHFHDQDEPAEAHAQSTLEFHRQFRTDLVKVMSDYPYPKSKRAKWYQLRVDRNPFPEQIHALELIRDGLAGEAPFVETIFNPWKVAENLSSPDEVKRLRKDHPRLLMTALEAIAESEAQHAKKALAAGASGIFLAIANAQTGIMTRAEYAKYSEPFDKLILTAAAGAPLNTLHLHGDKVYVDHFLNKGWAASSINYSVHGTGISVATVRKKYPGLIMAGIDERNFRKLTPEQLAEQAKGARAAAGKKFLLAPGCSVPDDSADEELLRFTKAAGA